MDRVHDLRPRTRARAILGIGLIVTALTVWLLVALHEQHLKTRLLTTGPEQVIADAELAGFARARGAALYRTYCASCHGARLGGDPSRGVPDLTDDEWLYGSGEVAEIERIILYGIRSGNGKGWKLADMPAFGSPVPYARMKIEPLTPTDIRDTVEFLRRLGGQPADAGAAARGAQIFGGRGACYDCHGADGRGDSAIGAPNLAVGIWLYGDGSRASVFESIARGHQGACPAWTGRLAAWQARALAVYVRSASRPAATAP